MNAATANATATGTYSNWAMRSFFGRVNLNWDENICWKPIFVPTPLPVCQEISLGLFSFFLVGLAYGTGSFHERYLMVNQLKLRASYGSLGNNAVGNYDYQLYYQASNYVLNDALQIGMAQRALSMRR